MDFIPVQQTGGIGDLIISLPFLEECFRGMPLRVYANFPEILKYFAPWIPQIESYRHLGNHLDYVIEVSDVIKFKFFKNNVVLPETIKPLHAFWKTKEKTPWWEIIHGVPNKGNEMGTLAVSLGLHRTTMAFYIAGLKPKEFTWDVADVQIPNKFITVHDGFDSTGNYKFDRSMKSWNIKYWAEFVALFKKKYPSISVIQLGGERHRPIEGVDINYAGKLAFEQSLRYLKTSLLHVDGDSGLVHARKLFNKPSVVMFGPTNIDYFGYRINRNIKAPVCGDCWWKKGDWMAKCVLGHPEPLCMESIKPEMVLEEVRRILGG